LLWIIITFFQKEEVQYKANPSISFYTDARHAATFSVL